MPCLSLDFLPPDALSRRLQYLLAIEPHADADRPQAALAVAETFLPALMLDAERGNVSAAEVTERDGRKVVAVSIQERTPRLLMPLDYVGLDLATAFGLRLTIQRTAADPKKRMDYPRISSPGPNGYVFQVLRILTDAQPGQVAMQRPGVDHHDLRRGGLLLSCEDAVTAAGKSLRSTVRGRTDLIACAKDRFEANRTRLDVPTDFDAEQYARLLALAFGLADWLHGERPAAPAEGDTLSAA
ncbi:hypothetical protein [Aureimonas mangrovi]|uniref:hypothetical protein n=1 Tax=Aureimonas mangrovi TaxID=2758041 RepID=UPI00163D497A|nr:hypothetical protein [Aureimonas mangrovi]